MLNSDESFAFAMKYADDELIHILFFNFLDDVKLLEKEGADFCVTRSPCPPIPRIISRQFSSDTISCNIRIESFMPACTCG